MPDGVRPTHIRTAQYEFDKCVRRYGGNHRVRLLPTYERFLVLAFVQLTYRESLRDISTCLGAVDPKLYHSGARQTVARSTLADTIEKCDWRTFADFAHVLIDQAAALYADELFGVELQKAAYALPSSSPGPNTTSVASVAARARCFGRYRRMWPSSRRRVVNARCGRWKPRLREHRFYVADRYFGHDYNLMRLIERRGSWFVFRLQSHTYLEPVPGGERPLR